MVDASEYHEQSRYTPEGVRERDFSLDFENKPRPYKVYEDRPHVAPPVETPVPETPALDAIATAKADPECDGGSRLDF